MENVDPEDDFGESAINLIEVEKLKTQGLLAKAEAAKSEESRARWVFATVVVPILVASIAAVCTVWTSLIASRSQFELEVAKSAMNSENLSETSIKLAFYKNAFPTQLKNLIVDQRALDQSHGDVKPKFDWYKIIAKDRNIPLRQLLDIYAVLYPEDCWPRGSELEHATETANIPARQSMPQSQRCTDAGWR